MWEKRRPNCKLKIIQNQSTRTSWIPTKKNTMCTLPRLYVMAHFLQHIYHKWNDFRLHSSWTASWWNGLRSVVSSVLCWYIVHWVLHLFEKLQIRLLIEFVETCWLEVSIWPLQWLKNCLSGQNFIKGKWVFERGAGACLSWGGHENCSYARDWCI